MLCINKVNEKNFSKANLLTLLIYLGYLSICVFCNFKAGAFSSELGGASDEPAHYLTVVMFKKYFLEIFPAYPLNFFLDFYQHYPKCGLGNWPPGFYFFASIYSLFFGSSIASLIFLECLIAALQLTLFSLILRKIAPFIISIILPLILFFCFEWQKQLTLFMIDQVIVAEVLLCVVLLARYLQSTDFLNGFFLSAVLSFCVVTKGNFIFCFIWLPICLLSNLPRERLKKISTYYFLLPLFITAGCWYIFNLKYTLAASIPPRGVIEYGLLTLKVVNNFVSDQISRPIVLFVIFSLAVYARSLCKDLFALLRDVHSNERTEKLQDSALVYFKLSASALISYVVLHMLFQSGHDLRHYLTLIPLSFILITHVCCKSTIYNRVRFAQYFFLFGLFALVIWQNELRFYVKSIHGARQLAEYLLKNSSADKKIMIASDPLGQGGLIVEVANLDVEYKRHLIRSEKILADTSWSSINYKKRYASFEELEEILLKNQIDWIVVDHTVTEDFLEKHHFDLENFLPVSVNYKLKDVFSYENRDKLNSAGWFMYKRRLAL